MINYKIAAFGKDVSVWLCVCLAVWVTASWQERVSVWPSPKPEATKAILLLLSLPFASSLFFFLFDGDVFFFLFCPFFSAAHGFCLCCGKGNEWGSTVVQCVKLMMRQSCASFASATASALASLLCSRNGNEMSTKCRSKDAFINSPGTWSRLTVILRTRTRPATPPWPPLFHTLPLDMVDGRS